MRLFIGAVDAATNIAESCGGGSVDNDLPWGRNGDEDDLAYSYSCMYHAARMCRPKERTIKTLR